MGAVETLEMPEVPTIDTGIDFYEELRRFQVSLIRRALNKTGGSQVRAAALLKMKNTTLNSKIKQFRIEQ
jgi:DNA-binding NtrC family response regulator